MKKKKRFYGNAGRNQKWTEEVQGREIDFADKYVYGEQYSDKYDYLRPKTKKKKVTKKDMAKHGKRFLVVLCAFFVLALGYTVMDVYMIRTGIPPMKEAETDGADNAFNQIALSLSCEYVDSVSLDGGVMLDAVVDNVNSRGFNSIVFDIKRSEGSVGYKSTLATVDTYGAVAFPASNLKLSTDKLKSSDIMPAARVYCYLDNLVPDKNRELAVYSTTGAVYRDSRDNTYLNPNQQGTYSYIRDIISEAYEMGVTVFILDGYDLPDEISADYNDGFDYISSKLYEDIGTGIKLLKSSSVSISKELAESESDESNESITAKFDAEDKDTVYFVNSSADKEILKEKLEECGITNYILAQ